MNILILGGAGFAGSGLARRRMVKGDVVGILDFVAKPHTEFIDDDINYLWKAAQDLTPEDFVGWDVVIDLKAQADVPMGFTSPIWTCEQNIMATVRALECVKKNKFIKKYIIAGSGNEFGRPVYLPIDEKHPLTPHNPYSFSKAAEEMAGWAYHRCYGVPVTIMSNGACLGRGMRRDIFVFKWLYNILNGKTCLLQGGDQTRDLTYVTDILDAWELVIDAPPKNVVGEKFQVSYGEEHSVEEILDWCYEVSGKSKDILKVDYRPGEKGQRELFTNAKARQVLGYNPKVSPKEGIKLTYEWIKNEVIK